jgi:hypothetical protein
MKHICYIKNSVTEEIYDTRDKVLKLESIENLEFCVSKELNDIDWSTKPNYDLSLMYRLRAAQIRNRFDYVVFYFSGGSDSITALNAFVRNNIHIDEILIYVNLDTTDIKINNLYAVNYLKSIGYKGFVNVVNLNFSVIGEILKDQTWKNYECSSGLLHSFYRWRIEFYENYGYVKPIKREGNVAHVFSGLFPTIQQIEDNYYANISIQSVIPAAGNPDNVQFFTTNDMPALHVKQSHVLAKKIAAMNVKQNYDQDELKDQDESKFCKLAIRDEYVEKINTPKGKGITNLSKMASGSQHELLAKLYEDKPNFISNYDLVLQHFNSFNTIDLDYFNKNFFLFSAGESNGK